MHGIRYVTALRRMAFSSVKACAPLVAELRLAYRYIMPAVLLLAVGIYICRGWVTALLFSADFSAANSLYAPQLIGDVVKIASFVLSYVMLAKAMTRLFVASEFAFAISYVVLVYLFTARFGMSVPLVEPAVGLSAIFLGLLVSFAVKAPVWLGAGIVGVFGFFHGHAHGTESAAGSLIAYAAGFSLATTALHAAGIGLSRLVERSTSRLLVRALGALTVVGALAAVAG